MELNTILNKCAWADAAARLNNNFQRIRIALVTSENNISKNKGYFSSVEELNAAHPEAVAGCQAYVGTSEPYAIYRWIIDETTGIGSWVDTGETGGGEGTIVADKTFLFTQGTASKVWVITHDLNKYPSVTVMDSGGSIIVGDVVYDSVNQITVSFSAEFAGTATLN